MHPSHTSTGQWQSFESRMRQRRVQRCVARASEALDARRLDEARAALEEAEGLIPGSQDVSGLAARVAAAERVPAPLPPSRRHPRLAFAAALLIVLAAVGWLRSGSMGTGMGSPEGPVATRPAMPIPSGPAAAAILPEGEVTAPQAPAVVQEPREPAAEGIAMERAAQAARTIPPARDAPTGTTGALADVRTVEGRRATALPSRALETRAGGDPPPPAPPVRATVPTTPMAIRPEIPAPDEAPRLAEVPAPAPGLPVASGPDPAAVTAPVVTGADPGATAAAHEHQVRAALNRYQAAYSELDAAAAGTVWPSVDRRALARAFDGLASQRVSLGQCDVRVSGTAATAECTGQARWTPKVGAGAQTAARRWRFELTQAGDEWIITQASVR